MRAEGGGLNRSFEARRLALIAAMVLFPLAVSAQQIVIDPTRPATGFAAEAPEGGGGNQLQSVMISPTRKAAIISGVVVELGGKYGDAVLMRVAEDEVVLGSGDSRQVLKLHPAVEKKFDIVRAEPVTPATTKTAPSKAKAKAKAKPKARANAKTQRGATPAADSSAETR
jgi:MSHA biogenesis protein MshK